MVRKVIQILHRLDHARLFPFYHLAPNCSLPYLRILFSTRRLYPNM